MTIDLTASTPDRTSVAETLAKYFWTLRVTDGENLPGWDELNDEERQKKIEGAVSYLTPILSAAGLDTPAGDTADDQARIHISNLLRRPDILPEDRAAAEEWLRAQPAPDTSMEAIRERHGTEPGTLEEFEGEHGAVQPPDGEG